MNIPLDTSTTVAENDDDSSISGDNKDIISSSSSSSSGYSTTDELLASASAPVPHQDDLLPQQEPTIQFAAFPERPQIHRRWWQEENDDDSEEYEYESLWENIQNMFYAFYTRFTLWFEDTKSQFQQERQFTTRSQRIAEMPFCIATFGSIYGTFILFRAAAVSGWIVDHSHWDGTGHDYDKDVVLAINTLETIAIYISIICGIVIWILLIARTRMCFYFISKWCLWLAFLQGAFCLSSIYGFTRRSDDASLISNDNPNYVYSRGFWSCLCSGILFVVAGLSFTVDWLLAYPYSKSSIILKGLVLPSIMLCSTVSIGTLSYMALEDWSYSEAIVFCWTAITTIGYGDISPSRPEGRTFFLIYTVFGISIVGYMLLSIRAVITGTSSDIMKVNLMRVESLHDYSRHQRQKWMNQQQYRQQVLDNNPRTPLLRRYSTTASLAAGGGNDTMTTNNTNDKSMQHRGRGSYRPRSLSNVSTFSNYTIAGILNNKDRQILVQVITKSGAVRMGIILIICWFGGAGIFCLLESDWSYLDGLYFVFGTQLTIGFGDIVPKTALAQEFWLTYIIISIAVAAYFISLCGDTLIEKLQIQDDIEDPESLFYTDEVAGSPPPMDDYSYMPNYRPEGGALEIDEDNTNESPLSSSLSNKKELENKRTLTTDTLPRRQHAQQQPLIRHSSLPIVSGYPSAQQSIGTKENRGRVGRTRSFLAKKKPHPLRIMYPPPLQQQSSSLPINPAAEDGTRYFNSGDAIIPPSDSNNDTNTKRSRVRSHSQYGSFSILPESSNRDIEYFDKDYKNIYKLKHPASPASPASPVSSSEGQEKPNAISPSNMKKEQYDQREHRHSILSSGIGEETISNHTTIIASSSSSSTKVKNQQEKENINMKKKKLSKYLPIAVTNSHHKKHH